MNDKIKHILIDITVVFVIPFALFYLYTTLATPTEPLFGSVEVDASLAGEGQKFLSKLNELQALKLDTSVFESSEYKSLVDTSVPPPTEEAGRPHPFIPPVAPSAPVTPASGSKSKTQVNSAVKNLNSLVGGR
jgi:hypothetical protein